MDEAALRRLAKADALGSHGSAHVPLAALPPEEAEADISTSIQYLELISGQSIVSFSYPFGGAAAVCPALAPMLERAGIQFAFTMQRGINTSAQFYSPLFLYRVDTRDVS